MRERTARRDLRRLASRIASWLFVVLVFCGCASPRPAASSRPFVFHQDTFTFANEMNWEYRVDPATGKASHTRRQPPPSYSLHCFVLARSARQFFQFAQFDPRQQAPDETASRRLIQRVVATNPRRELSEREKIVIPGYANLYAFSQAQAAMLKAECGGAWQCYFQRGNWRMIFPFSRHHQRKTAEQLLKSVQQNLPPIVHLVRFPQLTINHSIVLFAARETEHEIEFTAYDPNTPEKPVPLIFNRARRRFTLPVTHYFAGGRVNVYQIYSRWNY